MIGLIRFTPPWLLASPEPGGDKGKQAVKPAAPPVFLLEAGSIVSRDQFEAELEGKYGAGMVLSFHLLEAALDGLRALLGDDATEIEELLRADLAATSDAEQLTPQEKAKVKAATEILAKHWPEYAALVERESRRSRLLPTLAFVQWCKGWENLVDANGEPIEYARSATGEIADELLRRVPFVMLRAAGLEAYGVQYGRTQAKN